jgi:hypothetical protein
MKAYRYSHCQQGWSCYLILPISQRKLISQHNNHHGRSHCPSTIQTISASAQGYSQGTQTVYTDASGNGQANIPLAPSRPICHGTIFGNIFEADTQSPVPGAVLLICQAGGDYWPSPLVDFSGAYSSGEKACPYQTYLLYYSNYYPYHLLNYSYIYISYQGSNLINSSLSYYAPDYLDV